MNYCFPKGAIRPYESLWSIVNKFAHWNVCDVQDIQTAFHLNRDLKGGWYVPTLLKWPRWDKERLAAILSVEPEAIVEGVIETYLRNDEISLSSYNIRYCRDCINLGYHSIIHQLLIFKTCPYHQSDLKDECIKCGAIIDPGLNSRSIANYYACQRCKEPFYDFNQTGSTDSMDHLLKSFKEIGDLLLQRKKNLVASSSLNSGGVSLSKIQLLWPFWRSVYGNGKEEGIEILNFDRDYEACKLNINNEYISAMRKIKKELLNHANCAELLLCKGGLLGHLTIDKIDGICEVAYAYIIWRLYWESENYYSNQGSIQWLQKRVVSSRILVDDYAFLLSAKVAKAVFEYECKSSWISSMRYARSMTKKSEFKLPGRLLPQLVESYWEVSSEGNKEYFTLARLQLPRQKKDIAPFDRGHLDKMAQALYTFREEMFDQVHNLFLR